MFYLFFYFSACRGHFLPSRDFYRTNFQSNSFANGDALAAGAVLDYFNDFMDGLCTGFYTDADGFWDYGIDLSMKSFMQAKLLRAMLRFQP